MNRAPGKRQAGAAKRLGRLALGALLLPPVLLAGVFLFELFGLCANHLAAARQTARLRDMVAGRVPDAVIQEAFSETGNSTGTGNHVECMSTVVFSSAMPQAGIERAVAGHAALEGVYWRVTQTPEGTYLLYAETSAPFPDHIGGH